MILHRLPPSGPAPTDSRKRLGTFLGVFVPCSLSMFSAILFLRMGYIVGFVSWTLYFLVYNHLENKCWVYCNQYRYSAGNILYKCQSVYLSFQYTIFSQLSHFIPQAGVIEALFMFTIAFFIVMVTILSVSAISTNGAIEGGGAYFMISRSIGPEFGGAMGIIFFFAQLFASTVQWFFHDIISPLIIKPDLIHG